MRNILICLFFLSSVKLISQPVYFPYVNHPWGGGFQIVHSIDFESPYSFIEFDSNSLWQIGKPQKLNFSQAWSAPNALLTDTVFTYPAYIETSFQLGFYLYDYTNLFISFNQRVDVAEGDSCFVEFSENNSEWYSYSDIKQEYDNIYGWQYGTTYSITDLNTQLSHIPDSGSNPKFFDTLTGWEQHSFWFLYLISTKENTMLGDSLFIRFRFKSGQNVQQRDGWMLDNFYIGQWSLGNNALNDVTSNSYISLIPNPSDGLISFDVNSFVYPVRVSVFDMTGKLVGKEMIDKPAINIQYLDAGFYFLVFDDYTGLQAKSKVLKVK